MKIRSETLRTFKLVHTWTGLLAGLLLFLAFYAGALTLFREDIAVWQAGQPHQPTVEAVGAVTPLVEQVAAEHPEARRMILVNMPGSHESGVEAVWWQPDGASVHARAGTGTELRLGEADPARLSVVIDDLHRTAGIPGIVGETLLGTVSFIYGLALISGLVLYLPVLGRDLFALRRGRNLKLLWQDAHNSIGVLSLPFHILFALTGAVMSIHDPLILGMNTLIYGEQQGRTLLMRTIQPMDVPKPSGEAAAALPMEHLYALARQQVPGFVPLHVAFLNVGDSAGVVSMLGTQAGVLGHSARVALASTTGAVLAVETAGNRPTGTSALSALGALHFGDYGGAPVQWIYFGLGMAGAFLFYSGNLLWLEARRRRQAGTVRHHQWLARLTVGFCLGCCAATSALFVVARAAMLLPDMAGLALTPVFWGAVAAAMAWAAMRPPVTAARDLLAAAALASAGIPLSSVLAGVPLAGIDLIALAGALAFAALAWRVALRARRVTGASVWDAAAEARTA